jgi:inorganic pyrophosphatase
MWHDINPKRITPNDFVGYVEIPKGSSCKYELDKETGVLILDRILYTATHYPMSYGFIPRTLGDDGDPLDIVILCNEPIISGSLVRCFPIGVINMMDDGEGDEKIVAIPFGDPTFNKFTDVSELPKHRFSEISHFFSIYKELEGKETVVDEVEGASKAIEVIERSIQSYKDKFC